MPLLTAIQLELENKVLSNENKGDLCRLYEYVSFCMFTHHAFAVVVLDLTTGCFLLVSKCYFPRIGVERGWFPPILDKDKVFNFLNKQYQLSNHNSNVIAIIEVFWPLWAIFFGLPTIARPAQKAIAQG